MEEGVEGGELMSMKKGPPRKPEPRVSHGGTGCYLVPPQLGELAWLMPLALPKTAKLVILASYASVWVRPLGEARQDWMICPVSSNPMR